MNELLQLALVLLAGLLLGALFFGGLWWTVLKGVSARRPALWFSASLLLRTGIVLAGFYLVSGADWKRLLLCMLGFIIARFIVIRLTDMQVGSPLSPSSDETTGETTSHLTIPAKDAGQVIGYSHSTKSSSGQVAGYLPLAGRAKRGGRSRDAKSLSDTHEANHAP